MPRPAGVPLQLTAKEHLGEAPGGSSGAQLYRVVENADTYVVKFKGSAQGIRILFNEYVSGRLGELIDVPFGDHALVEVRDSLHPPNGTRNIAQRLPGTQFGTTFYENGQTDLQQLKRARNFTSHFPGVIVFDTFIDRGDSRQSAFINAVEQLTDGQIRAIVGEAPLQQWQVPDADANAIIDWLIQRRGQVRAAIEQLVR